MVVSIKKCLFCILWISLFQGFLSSYFQLNMINYFIDVLQLFCLAILLKGGFRKKEKVDRHVKAIKLSVLLFGCVILAGWIINGVSFLQAIWGVRNYARFYLYFFLCYRTFEQSDYERIIDIFIKIFPIHIAVMFFQFFVEHLTYDFLGGIFGKLQGCAGGLMLYYGVLSIIILTKYEIKQIKLGKMLAYFTFILFSSALAELKAFFLFFLITIIVYALVTKNKIRGIVILFCGVAGFFIGLQILIKCFPSLENFFTIDNILKQLTNKNASYTYREGLDIGRSSIFYKLDPVISQWGGKLARWFGLGLGNAEYSTTFSFLNSSFYNVYSRSNYIHFSLSFLFVEMGYLGVFSYCLFFVMQEVAALNKALKHVNIYSTMNILLPVLCFFLIYYNSSLRTNYAFIIFSILPIIISNKVLADQHNPSQ